VIDRLGIGLLELEGRVGERGVRRDEVDRLPLDDLVAEDVHEPAPLEARPHPAGRLARLRGDGTDLLVVIRRGVGDRLVLGDPLEDEVLLEGPGGACQHALPQLVDVAADGIVVEAAAAQFEDRPLELPLGLPLEQGRRQVPGGRGGQGAGHLLPHLAAAMPFELVFELLQDGGPQGLLGLEAAEFLEHRRRDRGQFVPLDVEHVELHLDLLAAQLLDGRLGRDGHGCREGRSRLGLADEGVEPGELGVGERQLRPHDDLHLTRFGELLAPGGEPHVGDEEITDRGRCVAGHESAALTEQAGERLVDVGGGDLPGRPADRQPLPRGQFELRPHLDRELEGHRPRVGQEHGGGVEVGLADRGELVLLGDLRHRVGEQLRADLVAQFRLEPAADQPFGRAAGAESRQERRRHQFADGPLVIAVDVFPRDRDPHPALAGGDLLDRHVERERGERLVLGGGFGDGSCGGRGHGTHRGLSAASRT
jgi:hypothetical protein